ncbi:hypothetical protein ACOKFD_16875 [Flagellimonas sp. S174]|uniref:hypothetical protein n=1 Tax=Flagellimonas sp. S174 TaxID=3410790 RepID=UPI003BF5808A
MKKTLLILILFGVIGNLGAQTLVANPQDNQYEGGELLLERSNSNFNVWSIDNYQGYLRFHHDGSSYFSMDPSGNSKLTNNFSINSLFIASESTLPSEGAIGEGDWGNYILTNNTITRALRLGVSNDSYTRAEIEIENNNAPSGNIFFKTSNANGGASVRMKIASNGNVGIGTTSPSSVFEVKSTNNNGVRFNNNDTPSLSFLPNDGDSHFHISHTLDNRLTISHGLNVGGSKLFTIVNTGNVGIGTTSPDSKLTVKGNIHAEEVKVDLFRSRTGLCL